MYYALKCFDSAAGYKPRIEHHDDDAFRFWNSSERLESVQELPLKARAITDSQTAMAEFWDSTLPIMTKRLYEALVAAGVDNLDTYPVVLTDSRSGAEIPGYVAFNIIGLVPAAALENPAASQRLLIFRLAESIDLIIVHEKLKAAIEAADIDTLTFLKPESWVALAG